MGTWEQIKTYAKELETNPKPTHGMIYTCNCGWMDAEHIEPDYVRESIITAINL